MNDLNSGSGEGYYEEVLDLLSNHDMLDMREFSKKTIQSYVRHINAIAEDRHCDFRVVPIYENSLIRRITVSNPSGSYVSGKVLGDELFMACDCKNSVYNSVFYRIRKRCSKITYGSGKGQRNLYDKDEALKLLPEILDEVSGDVFIYDS